MLKIMLIQRHGATTHKVINENTTFGEFVDLVAFENFGKKVKWDNAHKTVQIPYSGTTYTMLEVVDACLIKDLTPAAC